MHTFANDSGEINERGVIEPGPKSVLKDVGRGKCVSMLTRLHGI